MKFDPEIVYFAFAFLLAALLWWGGSQPFAVGLFPPPWDKLGHALFFGAFSYLLWRGLGRRLKIVVFVVVCIISALDEWHQVFLAGRNADLLDWLMGALSSLAVLSFVGRRWAAQ